MPSTNYGLGSIIMDMFGLDQIPLRGGLRTTLLKPIADSLSRSHWFHLALASAPARCEEEHTHEEVPHGPHPPPEPGAGPVEVLPPRKKYCCTLSDPKVALTTTTIDLTLSGSVSGLQLSLKFEVGLAVDFHGRVHKPMAKVLMRELAPFGLMFIEEPVLSEHLECIPELAALSPAPIALGERLYSRYDFKRVLQTGGVDIIQPDPSHSGGITETRKIAAMAEALRSSSESSVAAPAALATSALPIPMPMAVPTADDNTVAMSSVDTLQARKPCAVSRKNTSSVCTVVQRERSRPAR